MDESLITVLYGEKKLEPVEYRVISKVEGPWWWRQTRYYIQNDFMLWRFDTLNEAQDTAYKNEKLL